MNCPHCGKEITNCTNLLVNPQLSVNNGCQPSWQGMVVLSAANPFPAQPYGLNNVNCAAGCAIPTNTFYIKF